MPGSGTPEAGYLQEESLGFAGTDVGVGRPEGPAAARRGQGVTPCLELVVATARHIVKPDQAGARAGGRRFSSLLAESGETHADNNSS